MDFALYHGLEPVACTPYRPQSKGKVEAGVGYLKKNSCTNRDGLFSYGGVLYSVPWTGGGTVEVEEFDQGRLRIWWHNEMAAEQNFPQDGGRLVTDPRNRMGLVSARHRNQASGLIQCYPEVEARPLVVFYALARVRP